MLRDPSLIPLSHQHQHGLALAVRIERGSEPGALAREVLEHYERELAAHFRVEEDILFSALPCELTHGLRSEHRKLEGLVSAIRSSPDAALLAQFGSLLRNHIRKEENELFEQLQRDLSPEQLNALGAAIAGALTTTHKTDAYSS